MNDAPLMHPRTALLVKQLADTLPQSVLLAGPDGVGLMAIAKHIAGRDQLDLIQPRNIKGDVDPQGTISVEAIRELHTRTRAKFTTRQIVIIDQADRMNASSQSAFLKLLEEPNAFIHFLLLSHHPERLKSTILSRVQQHAVQPITPEQTNTLIEQLGITDAKKSAQLQFIARGLPELLTKLAHDDELFAKHAATAADARTFLQGSPYQKLLLASKYHADRDMALQLLDVALQIARLSLASKPQPSLLAQMERFLTAKELLHANGNVRLVLATVALP